MTDTDTNITDLDQVRSKQRYDAALKFLEQPLAAASAAVHETEVDPDDRTMTLGLIIQWVTNLCDYDFALIEAIA